MLKVNFILPPLVQKVIEVVNTIPYKKQNYKHSFEGTFIVGTGSVKTAHFYQP